MTRIQRRSHGPASWPAAWILLPALTLALTSSVASGQGAPADTVLLVWTAPGDDGRIGTASLYDLRVSESPIDEGNWGAATVVSAPPVPLPAGSRQSMVVRGLTYGTPYYFAMKTADDAGNWSALSNVMRWDWAYDTAPPAAPTGLSAAAQSGGVRVSWSPNAEADLAGYTVYRALAAGGPYTTLHGLPFTTTSYVDGTIPAGTGMVWYQLSALDDSGNESARSSATSVTLTSNDELTIGPAFPNPSHAGTTVRIPIVAPAQGGEARIEIVNNVGQRVMRFDLGVLTPGSTEVQWDGRNEAGRDVAPGAYTAWLLAGSRRIGIRFVRVP